MWCKSFSIASQTVSSFMLLSEYSQSWSYLLLLAACCLFGLPSCQKGLYSEPKSDCFLSLVHWFQLSQTPQTTPKHLSLFLYNFKLKFWILPQISLLWVLSSLMSFVEYELSKPGLPTIFSFCTVWNHMCFNWQSFYVVE